MAEVLIRNLDDSVVAKLKQMAERERVSLGQKLRELVTKASQRDDELFEELARQSREATRGADIDIEALIREGRDRDLGGV